MEKLASFLKNNPKIRTILWVLTSVLVITIVLSFKNKPPQISTPLPTPIPKRQEVFRALIDDEAKKESVIEKLGKPLKEYEERGFEVKEFKSTSRARNHKVYFQEERVKLIKENVTIEDNKLPKEIIDKFGESDKILYGPDAQASYYLYIYPESGTAYIGHVSQKLLIEIWYFKPTTLSEFKEKFAPEPEYKEELEQFQ